MVLGNKERKKYNGNKEEANKCSKSEEFYYQMYRKTHGCLDNETLMTNAEVCEQRSKGKANTEQ